MGYGIRSRGHAIGNEPLGFDVPQVETVIIDRTDVHAMGAGETTITLAAHRKRVFDATGSRIRDVPFTRDRVKAALASRANWVGSAPAVGC